MKKILINLKSNNELLSYEAVSLAMTLATFDNYVQLFCEEAVYTTLMNPNSRIYGMLQSLELYDMPKIWLHGDNLKTKWLKDNVEESLASQIDILNNDVNLLEFDSVLSF